MEKDPEDDILSQKNFQKASGINFDSFLVSNDITPEPTQESVDAEDIDVAVGQVADGAQSQVQATAEVREKISALSESARSQVSATQDIQSKMKQ